MPVAPHHVLTRAGDGTAEVDAALARLAARGVDRAAAGLHQALYVTRADRTVVMTAAPASPLAAELRGRPGWEEPEEPEEPPG
jgi:hypothetical protein